MNIKQIVPLPVKSILKRFWVFVSENHRQRIAQKNIIEYLNHVRTSFKLTIYDIGARGGLEGKFKFLTNLKSINIIGFEPDEDEARRLHSNESHMSIYPFAIAEKRGEREFFITRHYPSSSLYKPYRENLSEYPIGHFFDVIKKEKVKTISLDNFVGEQGLDTPDFMKIDVQGAEYEILKGGAKAMVNCCGIILETHFRRLYEEEHLFPEVYNLLENAGFRLIDLDYHKANYAGEIVELDMAFVRRKGHKEDDSILKSVLFCVLNNNLNYAAHLLRKNQIDGKAQLFKILGQSADTPKFVPDSEI